VADLDADLGVMLSASHNPMPDNGIKLFARGGHKLPDVTEDAIETAAADSTWDRPTGDRVGRIHTRDDAGERYLLHLLSCVPQRLDAFTLSSTPRMEPHPRSVRRCCAAPELG